MKTPHIAILTLVAIIVAASAPATGRQDAGQSAPLPSSGMLQTMPHGDYQCALPGDAGGAAFAEVVAENFRIATASRYFSEAGSGTYILRGRDLTFTQGPKKGERFVRVGDNQLRKLSESGERSKLLCTRLNRGR